MTLRPILPTLFLLTAPAFAQEVPASDPAVLPPPIRATLPTPAATPAAEPTPAAAPTPRPRRTPRAIRTPRPERRTPAPTPTPTPTSSASPTPEPTPAILAPAPVPAAPAENDRWWLPMALALAAAAAGAGWWRWSRRERPVADDTPADAPEPVAPAPSLAATPALLIGYRPSRIGINIISVTADGEVTVTNPGDDPAEAVEVRVAVLGVAHGHDAAIATVHNQPPARLVAPPFPLAGGQARALRVIGAVSRDEIADLSVAGRPVAVPLVVVTIAWRDAAGAQRTTQAFAVGIERVDSPKLAPVWLDRARMYDSVAARPHGAARR